MNNRFLIAALLAAAVGGCNRTDTAPPAQDARPAETAPATGKTPATHIELISPVGSGKNQPIALAAGQSISGKYAMERDGAIAGFGIRIGNYHNESDGTLELSLCVQTDCRTAQAPLAGSKDNDYLSFELADALNAAAGQTVAYTLTRSANARKRLAIWSYPKLGDQEGLVDPTGKTLDMVPRLSIRLK